MPALLSTVSSGFQSLVVQDGNTYAKWIQSFANFHTDGNLEFFLREYFKRCFPGILPENLNKVVKLFTEAVIFVEEELQSLPKIKAFLQTYSYGSELPDDQTFIQELVRFYDLYLYYNGMEKKLYDNANVMEASEEQEPCCWRGLGIYIRDKEFKGEDVARLIQEFIPDFTVTNATTTMTFRDMLVEIQELYED